PQRLAVLGQRDHCARLHAARALRGDRAHAPVLRPHRPQGGGGGGRGGGQAAPALVPAPAEAAARAAAGRRPARRGLGQGERRDDCYRPAGASKRSAPSASTSRPATRARTRSSSSVWKAVTSTPSTGPRAATAARTSSSAAALMPSGRP